MYSSYLCLIYSRICFLMKSDPRTYHMDGLPRGYEPGDAEFDSYIGSNMIKKRASKRNVISDMAETRNADDTHENVGKKRCTEGSESL